MYLTGGEAEALYAHSDDLYASLKSDKEVKVLLYYPGDMSAGFTDALASRLEILLESEMQSVQALKRFFYAFVEAVQNVRIHGATDADRGIPGAILVYRQGHYLYAVVLNLATHLQSLMLQQRHDEVNAMDPIEKKKKYLDILQNGELSEKGGAGLGILTIGMRSKHPVIFLGKEVSQTCSIVGLRICISTD